MKIQASWNSYFLLLSNGPNDDDINKQGCTNVRHLGEDGRGWWGCGKDGASKGKQLRWDAAGYPDAVLREI